MRQRESWGGRGHLENLINAAKAAGLLDQSLTDFAHGLRTRSNDVLHGIRGKALVEDPFVIISDARLLIERLFSPRQEQWTAFATGSASAGRARPRRG